MSRPRLLSILDNILELKLLILAAPAGYGKTSLLVDFAHHTQLPVCWFAMDALDGDPQRFITHFIAAMANIFPAFGEASRAALNNLEQDNFDLDPVISAIINDVYEHITEHFVFVLDDYHLIRDSKPIDEFINRVALEMAENCHFVIASRTLLTLPDLTLLVARSQVEGLSFEELAFLPEEIKQLFLVNYRQNISEKNAEELVVQTEGWITGLLLTAQLSPKETNDRLRLARVSGIGLYEYLAQQVLDRQTEEMKLFLKRTSLLEEFDASLCERIFSKSLGLIDVNWQERLEVLLRENLFVLPVDDETLHLRYHHLFRDFLQTVMRRDLPEECRLIEFQLAQHFESRREWEQAYACLARANDPDLLIGLIIRAAPSMILGGRLSTLTHWIESVQESVRAQKPELLSISGTIALIKGDFQNGLSLLNVAIDGLRHLADNQELAQALLRRSALHRHLGAYEKARQDAEDALQICNVSDSLKKLKAEAERAIGLLHFQSGEIQQALTHFSDSLRLFTDLGEQSDAAKLLLDKGLVHYTLGQFSEADEAYQKSLNYWQQTQNSLWQANLLNNIGVLQHLSGKHEQAAASFEKAIAHARLASNPRLEGFSLTSLGDLYRDIRALPESRMVFTLAQQVSADLKDQALSVFLPLSVGALERISGDLQAAGRQLHIALKNAQKSRSNYELNLHALEQAALWLKQGKLDGLEVNLHEQVDFFATKGYHFEALRAQFMLALLALIHRDDNKAIEPFLELVMNRMNARDRSTLIQNGIDMSEILTAQKKKWQHNPAFCQFFEEVKIAENALAPIRRVVRRRTEVVQFSTPKFVVKALGRCQIKLGEHVVTLSELKTQVVRDLFFFILQHSEGVTKEEIGAAFWPESTLDALRLRFKNSIYRLRRALGSEIISFDEDYYRFNRNIEYDYDVENMVQELAIARAAGTPEEKIQHYKLAVGYYKGQFLPKLDYEWVVVQREHLHRQFIMGITELIFQLNETRQFQLAIHYADRAIEEDPCYEEAYRSAMISFSALGDRAGVSRQFEKCRATLKRELEIEPALQTRNLFTNLMQ